MPFTSSGKAILDKIYRTQTNDKPVKPITSEPGWDGRAQNKEAA